MRTHSQSGPQPEDELDDDELDDGLLDELDDDELDDGSPDELEDDELLDEEDEGSMAVFLLSGDD